MGANRPDRGLPLPAIGTCAVIGAVLCAMFALWGDGLARRWFPDIPPEPADSPGMTRIQEVESLVRRGPEGVPELVALLTENDPKLRHDALYGLGQVGPDAGDELEAVRTCLTDGVAEVRNVAIASLWRISLDPDVVAPAIAPLLGDADAGVRETAETTLVKMWRQESRLQRVTSGDEDLQLPREADEPRVARVVLECATSDSGVVRRGALAVLKEIYPGPVQRKFEAALRHLLGDPELHDEALDTLVANGLASLAECRERLRRNFPEGQASYPPAGPGQRAAMFDADSAARSTGDRPVDPGLLPDLIEIFDRLQTLEHKHVPSASSGQAREYDLDAHVEWILAELSAMKTKASPAVPHLLKRINNLRDFNRIRFAHTLFEIGADADEIVAVLVPIVAQEGRWPPSDSGDLRVRCIEVWQAAKLLVRVSPQAARRQVALAIPRLGSAESVNKLALFAIYGLSAEAGEALSALQPLTKHADPQVADIAKFVVGRIVSEGKGRGAGAKNSRSASFAEE